ncbi:hypothetical protein PEC302110_16790 [Pectobacterium araliae]|uniref:Uncharacterized protein n=1 Tax=Pectobacterium araliae TaxID=3073862 RepID=A0AAN0KJN2_9GAMM|nr:hypothetical protein PEC302110_16790 [Pectobacterium sp. MAFF 302110]
MSLFPDMKNMRLRYDLFDAQVVHRQKNDNPPYFITSDTTIIKLNNNYTEQFLSDKLYLMRLIPFS